MALRCDCPRAPGDHHPCGRPAVEVVRLGGTLEIPRCAEHALHLADELSALGLVTRLEVERGNAA